MLERVTPRIAALALGLTTIVVAAALLWLFLLDEDGSSETLFTEEFPFEILGPSHLTDGLQGDNISFFTEESWFFVLDLETDLVYRIRNTCLAPDCNDHVRQVGWIDDQTLRLETDGGVYQAPLSGRIT